MPWCRWCRGAARSLQRSCCRYRKQTRQLLGRQRARSRRIGRVDVGRDDRAPDDHRSPWHLPTRFHSHFSKSRSSLIVCLRGWWLHMQVYLTSHTAAGDLDEICGDGRVEIVPKGGLKNVTARNRCIVSLVRDGGVGRGGRQGWRKALGWGQRG
jgi:hypothetical protein